MLRLLAALGAAVCALAAPAAAQAVPRGHLTEREHRVLAEAYERTEAGGPDATSAQGREVCAVLEPATTRLLAAEHAACLGFARLQDAGMRYAKAVERCDLLDGRCWALPTGGLAKATREVARLLEADRRAIVARGLTGACARAFGAHGQARGLRASAEALADLSTALWRDDLNGIDRAFRRVERADEVIAASPVSSRLLRSCPRA